MLFNSVIFLVFFLPISLLVFYLLGHFQMNAAKFWLAAISFLFYGWWNPSFLLLLAGSVLFNYGCGYLVQVFQERPRLSTFILGAGIFCNLSLLFYFKYLMTLGEWLNDKGFYYGPSWGSAILPLGISFFTFTQIGFLIDTKEGKAQERGFLDYVLFVTFFPHLIAGPILHHREIMPQFAKKETYFLNWDNIGVGAAIFTLGLAKKVLIADQLAPAADEAFLHPGNQQILAAWSGTLCYSLQLYFDFSGYSEMALGIARMFNVWFPANFDSPYKSRSIIDFWQRFHISLTRYLTLYLYNPVSFWIMRRRHAKGLPLLKPGEMTFGGFLNVLVFPIIFTMTLIGIWHGAGFQFLIFGLLHAFYLCVNHAWRLFGPKPPAAERRFLSWLEGTWKWALTYLSVLVAQIFFKAKTATDAWRLIKSLVGIGGRAGGPQGMIESILDYFGIHIGYWRASGAWITLAVLFLFILIMPNILQLFEREGASLTKIKSSRPLISFQWSPNFIWGFLLGVLALFILMLVNGTTEFIYFRF